jgi:hypothetical protein
VLFAARYDRCTRLAKKRRLLGETFFQESPHEPGMSEAPNYPPISASRGPGSSSAHAISWARVCFVGSLLEELERLAAQAERCSSPGA